MWQLAILALASAASAHNAGATVKGVAFGPRLTLTCTWFTNFENSKFPECRRLGRNLLSGDGASIECLGRTCEQLDAEARRAAAWRKPEPPWGTFSVRLIGRVSLRQRKKQYLGDSTRTVLVEELLSVRMSIELIRKDVRFPPKAVSPVSTHSGHSVAFL